MITKIALNTIVVFIILLLQHIIFYLFSKEKKLKSLLQNIYSVIGASIFFGIAYSLIGEISVHFNSTIISFILLSSTISTYWFIINPLKHVVTSKNNYRDFSVEKEIKSKGYYYKILISKSIVSNAYATGIVPFYKTILIGENLKEKLNRSELMAIIYHEIGHHEKRHLIKLYIINIILQTFFFLIFFQINKHQYGIYYIQPILIALAGGLAGFIFWIIPNKISYQLEFEADKFSAIKYDQQAIIDALRKIDSISQGKLTKGNISHPKLMSRINNIKTCRSSA